MGQVGQKCDWELLFHICFPNFIPLQCFLYHPSQILFKLGITVRKLIFNPDEGSKTKALGSFFVSRLLSQF